ncbi:unnamed protein product [Caretta caretta]
MAKTAKYFAVILDCSPDLIHQEQMSLVLHYVDMTFEEVKDSNKCKHMPGFLYDVKKLREMTEDDTRKPCMDLGTALSDGNSHDIDSADLFSELQDLMAEFAARKSRKEDFIICQR